MAPALLLAAALRAALGAVLLTEEMQTFGGALKSFAVRPGAEQTLFNYSAPASTDGRPHTVTEQWFSLFGGAKPYNPNIDCRIRIYLDGAAEPDLDFQLFFAHAVGVQSCDNSSDPATGGSCIDPRVPWASSEVQHVAHGGALKNRYRIPFSTGVRVTATLPGSASGGGVFYYYVRGMTSLPVVVGDLQLPNAARLRLHKNWGVPVPPMGALPLVPPRRGAGLLYATMWSAHSTFIGFMEGCVRAYIDDQYSVVPLFMSSGTEDYFESANFFNAGQPPPPWTPGDVGEFNRSGETTSPESGVSFLKGYNSATKGFNYSMAAYKFHLSDPIVWWRNFTLTASNYDGGGADPSGAPPNSHLGCTVPEHGIPGKSADVTMFTYAWTYEW